MIHLISILTLVLFMIILVSGVLWLTGLLKSKKIEIERPLTKDEYLELKGLQNNYNSYLRKLDFPVKLKR